MDRGTSSRRLTWLLAVLAAAVAAGLAAVLAPLPPFDSTVRLPAAAFAVCFAVAELAVVQVPLREHRARVSLAEIPLVVGLFFIAPTELMAARVIGAGVVMLLRRQLPGPALLTRLALLGLATSLAILLFRGGAILVPQSFPVWLAAYPAALGAAIVAGLTGSIAVPGRRVREALAAQG
ncbi:MAG: hypothetical protein MUC54_08265, partial [Chloroflexi bacterium]|nr:hypothetical protein [Chloroflexota bacterium]